MIMNISVKQTLESVHFKTATLGLMMLAATYFFFAAVADFDTNDPSSTGISPVLQLRRNPRMENRGEFTPLKVAVETGLLIRNFSRFGTDENRFVLDAVVWFKFDPDEIDLSKLQNFSFLHGRILEKSPANIKQVGIKTLAKYNVIVELYGKFTYNKFPLEDHRLSIEIVNDFATSGELILHTGNKNFSISEDILMSGWRIKKIDTNFGATRESLSRSDESQFVDHPIATYTIDLERTGLRQGFIILIPIFFAFLFSLLSLFIAIEESYVRLRLSAASVATLLGYRFVIEKLMPDVGYFTTADYSYGLFLIVAFLILVIQIIFSKKYNDAEEIEMETGNKVVLKTKMKQLTVFRDIVFISTAIISTVLLGIILLI